MTRVPTFRRSSSTKREWGRTRPRVLQLANCEGAGVAGPIDHDPRAASRWRAGIRQPAGTTPGENHRADQQQSIECEDRSRIAEEPLQVQHDELARENASKRP